MSTQDSRTPRTLSRREFVGILGVAVAGGGLVASALRGYRLTPMQRAEAAEAAADTLGKLPRRKLGTRLGEMSVTPIVICQDSSGDLLEPSLAAGMNFIHKAGYWGSLPEVLKSLPRESFYTDITVDSTPNGPDDEEKAYNQVVNSLARNGLRYYDIFRAHYGWKTVAEMRDKRGTYRAFERLKKEGKVKYFGVSQHAYVPYPEILSAQIEDGLIDSIQLFYSVNASRELNEVLATARAAGIGITAMKVVAQGQGAMRNNPERQAALKAAGQPGRALLRHVLTAKADNGKPVVDCCATALRSFEQFEENLGAVSTKVMAADGFTL